MKEEKILKNELERLISKYCRGKELTLSWQPVGRKRVESEAFGRTLYLGGEVKNGVIYVYESDIDEALDVLRHEFFENFLDELIGMGDTVFNEVINGYIKAVNLIRYKNKESVINTLVKIEKEEIKHCSKTKK